MKKLIFMLLFSTTVFAQQGSEIIELTRPMKCSKVEVIMDFLKDTFGETMSWVGKDENNSSYLAIYKNKETGTWTLIQYDASVGCFLGSGKQGSPI